MSRYLSIESFVVALGLTLSLVAGTGCTELAPEEAETMPWTAEEEAAWDEAAGLDAVPTATDPYTCATGCATRLQRDGLICRNWAWGYEADCYERAYVRYNLCIQGCGGGGGSGGGTGAY